jgi:hypothetical protein
MASRDRRAAVLASPVTNGIDFVEIANTAQTLLRVHFLNAVPVQDSIAGTPTIAGGETIPTVAVLPVAPADWGWDDGHVVLTLRVAAPGDFSNYTLAIASTALDPFFATAQFSFKAGCPSDLDCAALPTVCPPLTGDRPPIQYLAKDFLSFRQALLDFSRLRYPAWQERSEADFGVMFLEALSAVADDLSYTQDRIANEASLLTATERRSVLRHARLVDYETAPALAATTRLQFDVLPGATATIPRGVAVTATATDGTTVTFETGCGLRDTSPLPPANPFWNRNPGICAYWFDDSQLCLPVGATHMYLLGTGYAFQPGQMLLIETQAASTADPPIRQIVHLLPPGDPAGPWASETCDRMFPRAVAPGGPPHFTCPTSPPAAQAPTAVTCIAWQADDKLTVARDLGRTKVIGNIADATQGRTITAEVFAVRPPPSGMTNPVAGTIERTGPRPLVSPGVCGTAPAIRLYTLANAPLTWLPQPTLDPSGDSWPEIVLAQAQPEGVGLPPIPWGWTRSLLQVGPLDLSFTIDPAAYRTLGINSDHSMQADYDGDAGDTIRFGDGVFGANPDVDMLFTATYRFGGGVLGNVAAGAISQIDPQWIAQGLFSTVMNPEPATGGADAQALLSVQRLAPQKFRAVPLRAVLASDYAAAADTLPWVKRAGTVFRWTGSWLTTFTTPEPRASEQIAIADRTALITLLNRYRMAGTESYVPDPNYVSIDLAIELCAMPGAFGAQVEQAVGGTLSPTGPGAATAFFAVSRFVFGQPLERSALEAAIQVVPGVAGVTCIRYRLRDRTALFAEMGDSVPVGANQILRCDNDPSRPDAGALSVTVRGGR